MKIVSELEDEVVFSLRMGPLRDQEIKQVLQQFPDLEFRVGSRVVTKHGVTGRVLLRELDDTIDLDQYVQFLRSERCPTENMDLFFLYCLHVTQILPIYPGGCKSFALKQDFQ